MALYRRETRVRAPLSDVWDFHSRIEGLRALTPAWMQFRVESVRGPDGEADPAVLDVGSEVRLSVRPFCVGPRRRWTSRIVERERRDDVAWFRDEMVEGPFPRWVHTHRFRADGEGTVVSDRVEYALPLVPRPLSALGTPFFEALFAYRHRRTKALLESGARGHHIDVERA